MKIVNIAISIIGKFGRMKALIRASGLRPFLFQKSMLHSLYYGKPNET